MTNLFDSVATLGKEYPCLLVAVKNYRRKLDRCLSKMYADVDSAGSTDHKAVLLGLEGQARAETSEKDPIAPGFSDALGIAFNAELLAASNWVAIDDQGEVRADDEILGDINGAAYVALLEQAITHEMAHIKHHHEGWSGPEATDKNFKKITPVKPPLYGESGFAIEAKIRNTYFPADDPPKILTAKTHNQGIKNIVRRTARNNPFRTPLYLRLQEYRPSEHRPGDPLRNFTPQTNLTLEQIREYMDFPKEGDECVEDDRKLSAKPSGSSDEGGSGPPGKGDDADGDGDGDEDAPPAKKKARRSSRLTGRVSGAKSHSGSIVASGVRPNDGVDVSLDWDPHSWDPKAKVEVDAKFCDPTANPKESFSERDDIYVKLTVQAKDRTYYFDIREGQFGRFGMYMGIQGANDQYKPTEGPGYEHVRLKPGESRNFFMRFSIGSETRSSERAVFCLSHTPTKPGSYVARVQTVRAGELLGTFPFHIIDESS